MKKRIKISIITLLICILLSACTVTRQNEETTYYSAIPQSSSFSMENIPEFNDEPYVTINNNMPDFNEGDYTTTSYEEYGELDNLGRCTVCIANIGVDIMPTEERGSIGKVKPTGWQSTKYDNIDGKYLYNRCHLIGYQLTAENANEKNLITGTRYLNVDGMLPFENLVADYVRITENHVLYRVTPIFEGDELVARGVQMEAYSIEDDGKGVCFNAYCYNNQPGIQIDYTTGKSSAISSSDNYDDENDKATYIINTSTKKFHNPDCKNAQDIKNENKKTYTGSRANLIKNGYTPCQTCNA